MWLDSMTPHLRERTAGFVRALRDAGVEARLHAGGLGYDGGERATDA